MTELGLGSFDTQSSPRISKSILKLAQVPFTFMFNLKFIENAKRYYQRKGNKYKSKNERPRSVFYKLKNIEWGRAILQVKPQSS